MNPKVSIIIPVYNGSNYLKDAIDSALTQTYDNIEILVINDGSNDDGATEEIAKSYGNKIRYFKKKNGGVATALNLGIEKMTGEYFSWLSHDDMYYPEKIEKQVKKMMEIGDRNTIVVSDWSMVDTDKKLLKECIIDDRLEASPMCFLAFDTKTWLNACAMLIPKSVFKKVGLFDEKLKTTQDYDMHCRMILHGIRYKILHEPVLYSRVHSEQGSFIDLDSIKNSDLIHLQILKKISDNNLDVYFDGNYDEMLYVYDTYLMNKYKISSPVFIKMITNLSKKNNKNATKKIILRRVFRTIVSLRYINYIKRILGRLFNSSTS